MSKELDALEDIRYLIIFDEEGDRKPKKIFVDEICPGQYKIIKKGLKALELLKKNLVIAFEEDNGIDLPTLVVGIKTSKNKLCVIYSTQDKEEIRILQEVLL